MKNGVFYLMSGIVCLLFVIFMFMICNSFFIDKDKVTTVKIELIAPPDSIESSQYYETYSTEIARLDSVIVNQERELNQQYSLFMKARQEEADLVKILSCVGAFVIAMFSLLGIKKFSDLHQACSEEAKSIASERAEQIASTSIRTEVADRFRTEFDNDKTINSLKDEITKSILQSHITPLEQRIIDFESKISNKVETSETEEKNNQHNENKDITFEIPMPEE